MLKENVQCKRLKYIVSYDCPENISENRVNILASSNKIDYIVDKLNKIGYAVDLISTSQTKNNHFYGGKLINRDNNTLRLFPTTPRGGVGKKIINVIVMRLCIALYLLRNVKREETILIYHSVGNMWLIPFLKKLKKAYIIEEVEEIYGDIYGKRGMAEKERKILEKVDAYIYPTKMLNDTINKHYKDYIIVHGSYKLSKCFIDRNLKFSTNDSKFHVGYTGILDPKKGCFNFIEAAKFLDDSYHLHILGFGNDSEIEKLQKKIFEICNNSSCLVSYDGIRQGKDYNMYLQQLDAGICPLDNTDYFTRTQFPSKVISYIANGLKVICSDVEVVKTSDVGHVIYFYDGNSPENIAKAIIELKHKSQDFNCQQLIADCDIKFENDLKKFLKMR